MIWYGEPKAHGINSNICGNKTTGGRLKRQWPRADKTRRGKMKALTGKLPSITVVSIVEVTELAVSKLFLSSTKVIFFWFRRVHKHLEAHEHKQKTVTTMRARRAYKICGKDKQELAERLRINQAYFEAASGKAVWTMVAELASAAWTGAGAWVWPKLPPHSSSSTGTMQGLQLPYRILHCTVPLLPCYHQISD